MAITVAAFETQLDAAVTAIAAGDYPTARSALLQARVIAAGLPIQSDFDGAKHVQAVELLKDLEFALSDAEAGDAQDEDLERRMITTRTSHGS